MPPSILSDSLTSLTLPSALPPEALQVLDAAGRPLQEHTQPSLLPITSDPLGVTERSLPNIGGYLIGSRIGTGGTSWVYEGADPSTGRPVAVKVQRVRSGWADTAGTILQNEAAILGHLRHPNVLPLLAAGQLPDGRRWLAFPLMAGGDLHSQQLQLAAGRDLKRWPLRRRLASFLSVCAAVEHAHSMGVIHRDLKPRNVMFDDEGFVQLADWGLAGPPTQPPPRDQPSPSTAGTPGYMAPEQISPRLGPVDARSDVWSLGAVLYEAITLRRAIAGKTITERMVETLAGRSPDPRTHAPQVPDALALACRRALERAPEDRFATVLDLAIAVGAALGSLPPTRRQ